MSATTSPDRKTRAAKLIGEIADSSIPVAMSYAELARFLDVSDRTIFTLVDKGTLVRNAAGKFDIQDSVRRYLDFSKRSRGNVELEAEKLRLVREQADRESIRNAAARDELVEASAVERRWTGVLRNVRSSMLAVPSRVAGRAAHLTPADLEIIDREIRDALQELADDDHA